MWEKHSVTGKQVRETRLPEQVACVSSTNKRTVWFCHRHQSLCVTF